MAKRNLKTRQPRQRRWRQAPLKWLGGWLLKTGNKKGFREITAEDRDAIAQRSIAAMWRGHKRYPSPVAHIGIMPADHARLEAAARRRTTRGHRLKWIGANGGFGAPTQITT